MSQEKEKKWIWPIEPPVSSRKCRMHRDNARRLAVWWLPAWVLGQCSEILATQLCCLLSRWVSPGFTHSRTLSMFSSPWSLQAWLCTSCPSQTFFFFVICKFKRKKTKQKANKQKQPTKKKPGLYFVVNRDYISSPRTCSGSVMTSVRMIYWLLWPELKLSPKGLQSLDTSLAFSVNLWERWL